MCIKSLKADVGFCEASAELLKIPLPVLTKKITLTGQLFDGSPAKMVDLQENMDGGDASG